MFSGPTDTTFLSSLRFSTDRYEATRIEKRGGLCRLTHYLRRRPNLLLGLEAQLSLVADRGLSVEAQVLEILAELMAASERPVIPVADIVAEFIERYGFEYERAITNRWIGSILRKRLNIGTYKSHGVYVVPMGDRSKIELLCARYGVSVIGGPPPGV